MSPLEHRYGCASWRGFACSCGVLAAVQPGIAHTAAAASQLAARAPEAVAGDEHRPGLETLIPPREPDGLDRDAVEHLRQSRLRLWQASR